MGSVIPESQLPPEQITGGGYTHVLTDAAETKTVVPGAGGRVVVVDHDTLIGPGPSQTGVPGNERGSDAKVASTAFSDQPTLDPANYLGTSAIEEHFASLATQESEDVLVESETETGELPSDLDFETAQGPRPEYSALQTTAEQHPAAASTEEQATPSSVDEGAAFENRTTLLTATEQEEVYAALVSLTGLEINETLTPKEKKRLEDALQKLAKQIANDNERGEPVADLHSFDPSVVLKALTNLVRQADISLDRDTQNILENTLLPAAANSVAALNATSGEEPPVYPDFETLNTSTNSNEIYESLLNNVDLSGYSDEELAVILPQLQMLAQSIATQNGSAGVSGIESPNAETVSQTLMALLGIDDNPALSTEAKAYLRSIAGDMAENIASMNEAKWTQDTYSADKGVVFDALKKLSNLDYDTTLSPEEKLATEDYLKVLSMVMAFMSQIRTKMAQLDAYAEKLQATGQAEETKNRTAVALERYADTMDKIKEALHKIKEAKEKGALLKVIGPVIGSIIIAIVAALLVTVAVVVTVVLIVLAVLASVTVVGAILIVAVIAILWTSVIAAIGGLTALVAVNETNCMDKLCDKLDVEGAWQRALVKVAFQLLFFGPTTFIVFIPYIAVREGIVEGYEAKGPDASRLHVATTAGSAAFATGVVTNGIRTGLVAAGANDKDADTAAMILTLILMLLMLLSLLAASRSGVEAASGGDFSLEGTALGAAIGLEGEGTAPAGQGESLVSEAAQEMGSSLVQQMLQNLALSAGSTGKDPTFYLNALDFIQKSETPQAQGNTQMERDLSQDVSYANSLLTSLTEDFPELRLKLEDLQHDAKTLNDTASDLISLFEEMIAHSSILSNPESLQV